MKKVTETRLALELKRAACCVSEKAAKYAKQVSIGRLDKDLLTEIGLLNGYIDTLRYESFETAELDVDVIAFQSGNIIRYTFNSLPNISTNYNILIDVGIGDKLKVTVAGKAINNGTFDIKKVGGLSDISLALDVNTITWLNDYTVRYAFNGAPDLSSVVVGDRLIATLSTKASNNGDFRIRAIDDVGKTITITNVGRIDDEDDEIADSTSVCDVKRLIDFIEITNGSRDDVVGDEASDSPAKAVVEFSQRNYTDIEINNILNHIQELCVNCGTDYLETA